MGGDKGLVLLVEDLRGIKYPVKYEVVMLDTICDVDDCS